MRSIHQRSHFWRSTLLLVVAVLSAATVISAQDKSDVKLEASIAKLRRIDQSKLTEAQKTTMAHEIDSAWDYIKSTGPKGVARLKQEVKAVDQGEEVDDFFKLNAAALLWIIGKIDEADSIAAIWKSTPLVAQYNYVFYTAFEAAQTQDPRVLPMLEAVLRDQDGYTYIAKHSLEIRWPLSLEFIWGAYGAKGLPFLLQTLQSSKDSITRQSCIHLLTGSSYLKALPTIRDIAIKGTGDERFEAIQSLGMFGRPQDYEFLITDLNTSSAETTYHHVYALYEFEDLRAVPLLLPLLKVKSDFLRWEVISALLHLATPASYDAVEELCRTDKTEGTKKACTEGVARKLEAIGLEWSNYVKLTKSEKEDLFLKLRQTDEAKYQPQKDDKKLSHPQLLEAIAEWSGMGRAFTGKQGEFSQPDPANPNQFLFRSIRYGWVEERHVLTVATPDDADALMNARAQVYRRLSDECLYEVNRINDILRRLARAQYRQTIELTEKVVAK